MAKKYGNLNIFLEKNKIIFPAPAQTVLLFTFTPNQSTIK